MATSVIPPFFVYKISNKRLGGNIMKKRKILLGTILVGILLAGCGGTDAGNTESADGAQENQEDVIQNEEIDAIAEQIKNDYDLCAIIREIDGGKVVLDPVEFITRSDTERMAELGLTEGDFPNGYYIYNADENTDEYPLAEGAEYNFIDWSRKFVAEDAEDIKISTKDGAVFEEYIRPYLEDGSKIRFFFQLDGNQISSITEEALTSM